MTDLPTRAEPELAAELSEILAKYRKAGGLGLQVLNLIGGRAENLLERLPDPVKLGLESATRLALSQAMNVAHASRKKQKDPADWVNTLASTAMGAAGGLGGASTALIELPITTTVLLRAIQAVAERHGFDPSLPEVQAQCLEVFASGGPLDHDDGIETGFLAARVTLTGGTVQTVLAKIAPRLAAVFGQKLGAQAVPILGAAAGAAINYAYASYYQDMADVHFRLLKLSRRTKISPEDLFVQLKRLSKDR